jgi:hypothetical protein
MVEGSRHARIGDSFNREAIPERSRGRRRFAASPGCDAHTRMNPDGVPDQQRRFAPGHRRTITPSRHARIGSAVGLPAKPGCAPRLNHGTPEAG